MPDTEIIDAEVVETGDAIEVPGLELVAAPIEGVKLFHKDDPLEEMAEAIRVAEGIKPVIVKAGMVDVIERKEFVKVEGWRTLGTIVGVFPQEMIGGMVQLENGWQCTVEAVTLDGRVVGRATSSCTTEEEKRKFSPTFELQGMAQTRATSRALRGPLGFVMQLGGFESTSAEEMQQMNAQGRIDEDAYQWDVLPEGERFTATVASAVWRKAKGKDKVILVAAVANANGGKPAAEKLWLEPTRQDYNEFVQHVCGGMEPPVGGSLASLTGTRFDITVSIKDGKWRNYSLDAATPPEASA
jgi:hypothetical protein